jgi:hypothetical protein
MRGVLTLSILAALIALLALTGYVIGSKDVSEGEVTLIVTTLGGTSNERFDVKGSVSALRLLKENHDVETVSSYVKCIDEVCTEKEYQWFFYVNGKRAAQSPDDYIVKRGEIIEFRFGKGGGWLK